MRIDVLSNEWSATRLMAACGAACLLSAGSVQAGIVNIAPLYLIGDVLPNTRSVTGVLTSLSVNNQGRWLVELRHGAAANDLSVWEGVGFGPGVERVFPFELNVDRDSMHLDNSGNLGWNDGTRLWYNGTRVAIAGTAMTGTTHTFNAAREVLTNDSGGLSVVGRLNLNGTTTFRESLFKVSDPLGTPTYTVVAQEGVTFAGIAPIDDEGVGTDREQHGYNNAGQSIWVGDFTSAAGTNDKFVAIDGTILLREGGTLGGATIGAALATGVSINNAGQWAVRQGLTRSAASSFALIVNGSIFAETSTPTPGLSGFLLENIATTTRMTDNGELLWFGDFADPDTTRDTALFLNDSVLIREGDIIPGFGALDEFIIGGGATFSPFEISDDGRSVLFKGTLADGRSGVFFIAIPAPGSAALAAIVVCAAVRRRRTAR